MKLKHKNLQSKLSHTPLNSAQFQQIKPKISLSYLDGNFCISKCTQGEKAEIITTLHRMSKLTWSDLQQLGRKRGGHENIEVKSLNCNVPSEFLEEANALSFHNPQKIPIIGFRREDVFYIIAVDPKLKAYKH